MITYYKFLTKHGTGAYSGYRWPLPTHNDDGTWTPGEWTPALEGDPRQCQHGYHLCHAEQLISWWNAVLYEVEVEPGGIVHDYEDKSATTAGCRLTRQLETWNDRTARLFACDCAERALPIYEREHPGDPRPRQAIEVARRYANRDATSDELATAWATAWGAARDAAWGAARDAAWATARATAWAAAWGAARDAAWAAARATAGAAAGDAARDAAGDAAWAAAWAAEREWQAQHLCELLGIAIEETNGVEP
jgi:hypothetical protein